VGTTGSWRTSLFVGGARTGRALAPAHSSSDSHSWLGQRTHRRAHAATSKLTTSGSVTSLRACLVKSSSACGQCMLGTGAQGADQDLLDMAVSLVPVRQPEDQEAHGHQVHVHVRRSRGERFDRVRKAKGVVKIVVQSFDFMLTVLSLRSLTCPAAVE
jgi:hypothetical protein